MTYYSLSNICQQAGVLDVHEHFSRTNNCIHKIRKNSRSLAQSSTCEVRSKYLRSNHHVKLQYAYSSLDADLRRLSCWGREGCRCSCFAQSSTCTQSILSKSGAVACRQSTPGKNGKTGDNRVALSLIQEVSVLYCQPYLCSVLGVHTTPD